LDVPEIDLDELERRLSQGELLVDVREHDEWRQFRIAGARHVPLADIPSRADELPTDRPVLLICARGGRSRAAAEYLRSQGVDAINVAAGTLGWIEAGKPVEQGPAGA